MKKFYLQISLFILFPLVAISQDSYTAEQIDSFHTALDTESDLGNRLDVLKNLVDAYQRSDSKLSLKFSKQIIEEGANSEFVLKVINAKLYIAEDLQKSGNLDSSILVLKETLQASKENKNLPGIRDSYKLLGNAEDMKENMSKALEYCEAGYKLHTEFKDSVNMNITKVIFANNIANIFSDQNKYEEALEYYQIAIVACGVIGNKNFEGVILNNIGNIYLQLGNPEKAIEHFKKSKNLRAEVGNKVGVLFAVSNLLAAYIDQEDYENVKKEGYEALEVAKELEIPYFILRISALIAEAETNMGKPELSIYMLSFQSKLLHQSQLGIETESFYYMALFNAYFSLRRYDMADVTLSEYENIISGEDQSELQIKALEKRILLSIELNDNITAAASFEKHSELINDLLEESTSKLGEIQAQFINTENEQMVDLLEKDQALLRAVVSRNRIVLFAGGIIGLMTFFFLFNFRKKNLLIQHKNNQLADLIETKDSIFSFIGHDLKKPILAFRGVYEKLSYLLKTNQHERILALGKAIDHNAGELNNLTDNLLSWALIEKNLHNTKSELTNIRSLVLDTISLFSALMQSKNLEIENTVSDFSIDYDKHVIGTIFRNLLDNAIKFSNEGGTIRISGEKKILVLS